MLFVIIKLMQQSQMKKKTGVLCISLLAVLI